MTQIFYCSASRSLSGRVALAKFLEFVVFAVLLLSEFGRPTLSSFCSAQEIRENQADYDRDVRPLLIEKCSACHGALKQEAGLRLDHGKFVRQGSDSGSILEASSDSHSLFLQRITTGDVDLRMPPEGEGAALTPAQIQVITQWVSQGAPSPKDEPLPISPSQHWAWQRPVRTTPPELDRTQALLYPDSDSPIDKFIYAEAARMGLLPMPMAAPRTRLRRLYFDLIGLPPTPLQLRELETDPSPENWLRIVDRLLKSPAHGERWARHWMDVWRYSDWDGFKNSVRGSQRHIWRWRDWIVESLNSDKGYDQMIVEMLAADEVAPNDTGKLRATGFLARNYHHSNRNIWLDATVEHTSKAFCALTLNCARCHDHKYDPISQEEYYQFRAIFEAHKVRTDRLPGEADPKKDGLVRAYDADLSVPTFLFVAGNEKTPASDHPLAPSPPEIVDVAFDVQPIDLPAEATFPALRAFIEKEEIAKARSKLAAAKRKCKPYSDEARVNGETARSKTTIEDLNVRLARQAVRSAEADLQSLQVRWRADKLRYGAGMVLSSEELQAAIDAENSAKIEAAKLTLFTKQLALANQEQAGSNTSLENSDSAKSKGQAAVLKALSDARAQVAEAEKQLAALKGECLSCENKEYTSVGTAYPAKSSGRRYALAKWIVDRRNPLTARVAVNHIWMHHFGEPLVANVFDFGMRSPRPRYAELLDWLAIELMENNWSMLHLHRLIVTSRVYQIASSTSDDQLLAHNRAKDPDNLAFWRANTRRLDAEVIRDSLLYVAGSLDSQLGGKDIDFVDGETVMRRSLYFRSAYEKQMQMLVIFDTAAPNECYRRSESIVPQQALALANSPLAFDQSRRLAAKIWNSKKWGSEAGPQRVTKGDELQIREAFETLLGRVCTEEELAACKTFLAEQEALLANDDELTPWPGKRKGQTQAAIQPWMRARESLIHTLMNHNDFITIR